MPGWGKVFSIWFPQFSRYGVRLALLGAGGGLRTELEAIDPTQEWLAILPAVTHDEIPGFINKLDIFILPSKPRNDPSGGVWEEQFGHVLIESMACGILTLGSDSGAIPEVLCDPEVIFEKGNPKAIREMHEKWLTDHSTRRRKAAQQSPYCASNYSHRKIAQTYATFLDAETAHARVASPPPL